MEEVVRRIYHGGMDDENGRWRCGRQKRLRELVANQPYVT